MLKKNIFLRTIKLVWRFDKKWINFNLIYAIVSGLIPIATIWLSKEFINELSEFTNEQANITKLSIILILQAIIILFSSMIQKVKNYIDKKAELNLLHTLNKLFLGKVIKLPLIFFEDPQYHNSIKRVQNALGPSFFNPILRTIEILKDSISIISIVIYLLSIHWLLIVFVLIPIIPVYLTDYRFGIKRYRLMYENTPIMRHANYTSRIRPSHRVAALVRQINPNKRSFI